MGKPRIVPRRWRPPEAPGLTGPYARNDVLGGLERLEVPGVGPEDVAIDAQGCLVTGVASGHILRVTPDGRGIERIADTKGRPLGIEVDADGSLVVCDEIRGLLRVDPRVGSVRTLVDEWQGRPLKFPNNCAIAADGSIFFSESSNTLGSQHFKGDLLEHASRGRLLRWSPDGAVDLILDGLDFANGVALAADDSFVLVAESGGYRVRRVRLTGADAGRTEVCIDNLPGVPDNLSTGENGIFWIALASERNALLDHLLPLPGVLRKALWALPDRLLAEASPIVFVLGMDAAGTVVHNLQAQHADYHSVTGVREHAGVLYLSSFVERALAKANLPD